VYIHFIVIVIVLVKHVIGDEAVFHCLTIRYNGVLQKCLTYINEQLLTKNKAPKYGICQITGRKCKRVELRKVFGILRYATKDSIGSVLRLSNAMRTTTKGEDVFEHVG